jgi:hypothetical protein
MEQFAATTFIQAKVTPPEGDSIAFHFGDGEGRELLLSMSLGTFRAWLFAAEQAQKEIDLSGAARLKSD